MANLLKAGTILGQLEGLIKNIDTGTLNTSKNRRNWDVKSDCLDLISNLKKELSNN